MSLAHRVSKFNRDRKWLLFLQQFSPRPDTTILDVGFSDEEFSETDNYIEKFYPYPAQITALGIDASERFEKNYPLVKSVTYDGANFPFPDKSFDICWSNAVIEHVGDYNAQVRFLKEIQRVSSRAFITTPNRRFPVEVHTRIPLLHMLPKSQFDAFLRLIGKSWATGNYMHLSTERNLRKMLAEAGIQKYQIVKNRLGGFTLDFVVIIE